MKGMKLTILVSFLIAVSLISGCATEGCDTPTGYTIKDEVILLDKEGTISCELCEERGFHDKIIVFESEYCGACRMATPRIEEAASELGADVLFLDLSKNADSLQMNNFKVMPYYTPTMLAGCSVYIGGKSKEEYVSFISKFLENEH